MEAGRLLSAYTLTCMLETSVSRFLHRSTLGMACEKPLIYGDFHNSVTGIARMLKKQGVLKGDRIAILDENSA